jgi:endonuclease/exonuclease/phosphatase family metal-dependent hydrolase
VNAVGKNKKTQEATRIAIMLARNNPTAAGAVLIGGLAILLVAVIFIVSVIVALKAEQQRLACANDGFATVSNETLGGSSGSNLTAEQLRVAKKIWAVLLSRAAQGSFPQSLLERVTIITFSAAITESGITNPRGGDLDSGGPFQMRPSQGWGTRAQVTNVTYATNKFLSVMLTVPDWQTKPYGDVAQAVERSGYPDRYATHTAQADAIYKRFSGQSSGVQLAADVYTDGNCPGSDPTDAVTGAAVQAALQAVGKHYEGNPDGASLVSAFYRQTGLTLPSTTSALANFNGQTSLGLTTQWIPASSILSGSEPLEPGDILFWSEGRAPPSRDNVTKAGLYVGTGATGGGLRVATYNVRGSSHTSARGPGSGPARVRRAAALIMREHFAVVGLQELQANQRAQLLRSLGSRYGIYPSRPQYGPHVPGVSSVNSIIWDKSQVSYVAGRSLPMPYYFFGKHVRIPLVKFKELKSGQDFYVANTHDPARNQYASLRFRDAVQHATDANRLTEGGRGPPLFFTGDFNSGYGLRHGGSNRTYGNLRQNLTWCIMTRSGAMVDGYDAARGRTGCSVQTSNELGVGTVDHVFASHNVRVMGYQRIGNRRLTASDHGVVYIDAGLPGVSYKHHDHIGKLGAYVGVGRNGKIALQSVRSVHLAGALRLKLSPITNISYKGGGGPWQAPLHVSAPLTCAYGYGTCHGSEAHDGDDFGVPVGTPVFAAHSGMIYKAGFGSASGNQIIIDNDGRPGGLGPKYEHLSRFASGIHVGATVTVGQLIGYSGDTGNVTGPHLHFSVCTDTTQCVYGSGVGTRATTDPIPFMLAHGVKL